MRKYLYIIYDSILFIITLAILLAVTLHYHNILLTIYFVLAGNYFFSRIWKGICLIADIILGSKKKYTIFLGVLNSDTLDFFKKVEYTNIYFNDDEMQKNYMAFDDTIEETIHRGDKVEIEYYKYSRIVLKMRKQQDNKSNQENKNTGDDNTGDCSKKHRGRNTGGTQVTVLCAIE